MKLHSLIPDNAVSREIGFYLAAMDEVRDQLRNAVQEIPLSDIGRLAVPETHSIGALVLHIGEAEWWWMNCIVSGHQQTDEDAREPYWDVLEEPHRVAEKGYSAQFCLDQVDRIREQTRHILGPVGDERLDQVFIERDGRKREFTLRWILHHLIDHEAQHKGQILMLKRLLGKKNAAPIG